MVQRNDPAASPTAGATAASARPLAGVVDIGARPKVRDRNRRRVLDAARELVAASGLDALSMRTLAERAGVSATTLYNLFGTKDGIIRALATDILGVIDDACEHIVDDDPIEQLRARLMRLVDLVIAEAPPSLVSAVLEDAVLTEQINAQWASRSAVEDAIRDAATRGYLDDVLEPDLAAEHIRASLLHQQRLWAAGVTDDATYRAAAAYAIDIALLALARGATRDRLVGYLRAEQRELRR
jgi:AcrR family transcriptional regulator